MSGLLAHRGFLLRPSGGGSALDDAILARTPWGYWKLNEDPPASGGVAADSSGNVRNGTYTADTWATAAGLFGGSQRCPVFDATNTMGVTLPSFSQSGVFSVFFLFKVSSIALSSFFTGDTSGAGRIWQARMDGGSGSLNFFAINSGGSTQPAISPASIADGLPHMALCVYDASLAAGAGRSKLYLDGTLVAQSSNTITAGAGPTTPSIGFRVSALTNYVTGNVSNCALFQSALTSTDASTLWSVRNG